ncbi:hypothetical protein [Paenibacillus agri]|uniref:Uncharacterized protein n=1 Tax=Paenibacillus agri TaxID=2744309 RepID=A0A850EM04_9BACL|nr:hypothetical protein [Paenibacillus agri]NUU59592.1 hypothetical protein [Paenibacillus agri]
MIRKRSIKYISIAIIIALVSEALIITLPKIKHDTVSATQQDEQIAADLSNLTGVEVSQIMKLKNTGYSWNEVSERLKKKAPINSDEDKLSRSALLNEAGLGEEAMNQLREEGYQDDEIMEAKLLAERVMMQLQEVKDGNSTAILKPSAEIGREQSDETETEAAYEKIRGDFSEIQAVKLMLKLEQEFGSMGAVMNEYLLSLQADLNLEEYIKDKKLYQKNKEQQTAGLKDSQIITMEKLEKAMLDQLQQVDEKSVKDDENLKPFAESILPDQEKESPLPDIKPPTVKDVMPQNPAEAIRQEIQDINPNHR